uniref:Uncharacterized protein n=1 Tax=Ciona intestinalis TaxID=7719 RepID=H2XVJ3_CIOIN
YLINWNYKLNTSTHNNNIRAVNIRLQELKNSRTLPLLILHYTAIYRNVVYRHFLWYKVDYLEI